MKDGYKKGKEKKESMKYISPRKKNAMCKKGTKGTKGKGGKSK